MTGTPAAGPPQAPPAAGRPRAWSGSRSWLVPLSLVTLAAVARFVGLPARGAFDADQGTEMLTLLAWTRDGVVPLLGPPTSIGAFHHGALYYLLLGPAAFLSGSDPTWVVGEIALAGSLAVLPAWWLARSVGGPLAGALAGAVIAISATAIGESTFIWNPNLVMLPAGLAIACAWRAWTSRHGRWWVGAALAGAVVVQSHVLGVGLAIGLAVLFVADLWRADGARRRSLTGAGLAAAVAVILTYLPLIAYELGHDFAETRAAAAFLLGEPAPGGAATSGVALPIRFLLVAIRTLSWPLTGLLTTGPGAPLAALLASAAVLAIVGWRLRAGAPPERALLAWLSITALVSILVLTFGAAGLLSVVEALPVDQYHAFLDPAIAVVVGLGLARLAHIRIGDSSSAGRVAAMVASLALVVWNIGHWPPATAPDGGWPAADAAAARMLDTADPARPIGIASLPDFKLPDAYGFPLVRRGATVVAVSGSVAPAVGHLVVVCDQRYRDAIGADCGGPAEDRLVSGLGGFMDATRIEAAPGRYVSLYARRP